MTEVPARPRVRVRVSREGRSELQALGRSAMGHLALVLLIVVADWLNRIPWTQPPKQTIRATLTPAAPAEARRQPPPRPSAPRPKPTAAPEEPPPPPEVEPEEPAPELPGLEPPAPTASAPRPSAPRPRPRPSAPPAPPRAEPATPDEPAAPTAATVEAPGLQAAIEGWESGPGDPYLDAIVRGVSSKWLKPRTGLPGRPVIVTFRVVRSGHVEDIRIESPSGSSIYDRAAQRAVELASVPPLPATVRGDALTVHFKFLP